MRAAAFSRAAHRAGQALAEALPCPRCDKSRVVLNTAGYRQRVTPEAVSADTHCACPPHDGQAAGPAYVATDGEDA